VSDWRGTPVVGKAEKAKGPLKKKGKKETKEGVN